MECGKPLVSICIPAYNHEKYVQACIESIIAQDYANIELLIIDDGSSDATWAKIQELAPQCEKRFQSFAAKRQKNCGAAETCRRLEDMAQGEFCGFIASDDQYLPGAISALIKPMLEDMGIGLVVGVNEIMDSDGRTCYWDEDRSIVYDEKTARFRTFDEFLMDIEKIDFYSNRFGSYQALIKGNHIPNGSLKRLGLYKKFTPTSHGPILEDWWFHLQFSKVTKYKALPAHTFRYRWHAANTIKRKDYIKNAILATRLCERDLIVSMKDQRWKEMARPWIRVFRVKWHFWKIYLWSIDTVDEHVVKFGLMRYPIVLKKVKY